MAITDVDMPPGHGYTYEEPQGWDDINWDDPLVATRTDAARAIYLALAERCWAVADNRGGIAPLEKLCSTGDVYPSPFKPMRYAVLQNWVDTLQLLAPHFIDWEETVQNAESGEAEWDSRYSLARLAQEEPDLLAYGTPGTPATTLAPFFKAMRRTLDKLYITKQGTDYVHAQLAEHFAYSGSGGYTSYNAAIQAAKANEYNTDGPGWADPQYHFGGDVIEYGLVLYSLSSYEYDSERRGFISDWTRTYQKDMHGRTPGVTLRTIYNSQKYIRTGTEDENAAYYSSNGFLEGVHKGPVFAAGDTVTLLPEDDIATIHPDTVADEYSSKGSETVLTWYHDYSSTFKFCATLEAENP